MHETDRLAALALQGYRTAERTVSIIRGALWHKLLIHTTTREKRSQFIGQHLGRLLA